MSWRAIIVVGLIMASILYAPVAFQDSTGPVIAEIHAVSSAYEITPAASYRGDGRESSGGPGAGALHHMDNTEYSGEGRVDLLQFTDAGFIAWRIQDLSVSQVSRPLTADGYSAVAVTSYGNRLDVSLYIASRASGLVECPIAATSSYEEYPAVEYTSEAGFLVFFYNSSDRDYYLVGVTPGCEKTIALKAWYGGIYYRYAYQVASASNGEQALFIARDYIDGVDQAIAVYVDGTDVSRFQLTTGSSHAELPRDIAVAPGGVFIVPVVQDGETRIYEVSMYGGDLVATTSPPAYGAPSAYYSGNLGLAVVYVVIDGGVKVVLYDPDADTVVAEELLPVEAFNAYIVDAPEGLYLAAEYGGGVTLYTLSPDLEIVNSRYIGDGRLLGVSEYNGSIYIIMTGQAGDVYEAAVYLVATSLPSRGIELYTIPNESPSFLDPDNPMGVLGLVRNAEESVYAAFAFFERTDLADELINAHASGVDVAVVVDDNSLDYEAVQDMITAGIPVYSDAEWENVTGYSHTMHHKFMVVDGRHILIGTADPTWDGFKWDYQTIVAIRDAPELAYALTVEFMDLAAGNYGTWDENDVYAGIAGIDPVTGEVFTASVYQGPEHPLNVEEAYLVYSAGESIDAAYYMFTTSSRIEPLMTAFQDAITRGVTVTAVFDWSHNEDTPGRFAYTLYSWGAGVAFSKGYDLMHAKTLVADSRAMATGSYNPTGSGTAYNDESIIIVTGSIAGEASSWIRDLYAEWGADVWSVDYHLLIAGFGVDPDYIIVYNPLGYNRSLDRYVVGDAETLYPGDDEALYKFPGGVLGPGEAVIVAYNATSFYQAYGIWPDYEIVDSTGHVPDMEPFNTDRFNGTFSLDPAGDEVVLARISSFSPDFLYVQDMVPYGNSTALPVKKPELPEEPVKALARLLPLDSIDPAKTFIPALGPVTSGTSGVYSVEAGVPVSIMVNGYTLLLKSDQGQAIIVAVQDYEALATAPGEPAMALDFYSNATSIEWAVLEIPYPHPLDPDTVSVYYHDGTGWREAEVIAVNKYKVIIDAVPVIEAGGTPIVVLGAPATIGGELEYPWQYPTSAALLLLASALVIMVKILARASR